MNKLNTIYLTIIFATALISCEDFVEVSPPQTDLVRSTVFTDDDAAKAAIADAYYQLIRGGFASGDNRSISFLCALSSDEMVDYSTSGLAVETSSFNQNEISPNGTLVESLWSLPYAEIYRSNAIIEGLRGSEGVTESLRNQLLGEALFMRAFCHLHLVNLFGRVPIVTTTNYQQNTSIGRAEIEDVYAQIIQDLLEAKSLLVSDYSYSNDNRIRLNKGAATALLSRAYLYTGNYSKAEEEATLVISDPKYGLESDLSKVFTVTSSEVIWQLASLTNYPNDIFTFYIFGNPSAGALRASFVDSFEPGDQRRQIWVGSISTSVGDLYFPKKYQSFIAKTEYSTLLRVAEQYLIRAEARAHLDNISGSLDDLNTIRNRAQLENSTANDKVSLLEAIFNERRAELFSEWGHRWVDLQRFGKADELMAPIKPAWESTDILFPIPHAQIINSPSMTNDQNPGY